MATSTNPPGPGFWRGLAVGRRFRRDALGLLREWQRDYGDVVHLRAGPLRFYWLFHPDLAREVLIAQAKRFRRAGRQVDVLREWDGDGLVTSDGDFWLRQRRLVQPAFSAGRFPGYAQQMTAAASRLVDRWFKERPASVEMNATMTGLTLKIMAGAYFGADLSSETGRWLAKSRLTSAFACDNIAYWWQTFGRSLNRRVGRPQHLGSDH